MMKLLKGLFVCICFCMANGGFTQEVTPFVGADFEYSIIKANNDWRQIISRTYPGGNGFVGVRFSDYIGFELGYEWTGNKEKSHVYVPGEIFFALPSSVLVGTTIHTKMHVNGWHVDLLGYIPLDHCIDLFLTAGVGTAKARISADATFSGVLSPLNFAFASLDSRGRTFLRLGGGIQWMVTDMTGVRFLIRWRNTNRLSIRGNSALDTLIVNNLISRQFYQDSVTAAAGVFFRFY